MTEVDRGECVHAERPQYQSNDEGDSKVSISTDSGKKIGQTIGEKTETNPVFFVLGKEVVLEFFSTRCNGAERWKGGTAMRIDPPHGYPSHL